ncbi:MAG TPA: hypothetical protein VG318_14660 [Actinomycetota bacterium]|nr:hypothetical protein [Actinomycetota bacterium]
MLWAHALGTTVAGAAVGLALVTVGAVVTRLAIGGEATAATIVAGLAALYGVREAGLSRLRVPCRSRQVAQSRGRRDARPRFAAFVYGLGLGAGFVTYIPVGTFLVVAAWVLLSPGAAAVAAMAAYGAARAVPLFVIGPGAARDQASLTAVSDALFVWQPLVHLANGLALAFVASYLVIASSAGYLSPAGGS